MNFCYLLQEQDGLYLLDGKRISQLHIPSGKTKKKISKLHGLMNDVCALNVSQNGKKISVLPPKKGRVKFI